MYQITAYKFKTASRFPMGVEGVHASAVKKTCRNNCNHNCLYGLQIRTAALLKINYLEIVLFKEQFSV